MPSTLEEEREPRALTSCLRLSNCTEQLRTSASMLIKQIGHCRRVHKSQRVHGVRFISTLSLTASAGSSSLNEDQVGAGTVQVWQGALQAALAVLQKLGWLPHPPTASFHSALLSSGFPLPGGSFTVLFTWLMPFHPAILTQDSPPPGSLL